MSDDRDRDEQYHAAIRELSSGVRMPSDSAARIERYLLRTFAEYHSDPLLYARRSRGFRRWRPWLAAAAAAVAVSAGIEVWRESHRVTENHVTAAVTPAASLPDPALRALAVPAENPPAKVPEGVVHSSAGRAMASKRPGTRVVRPSGFVVIPGAAGLPQFESGTIMRIELPVASLPAYGVDISPAADDHPVEADVLVGQDGQARAIRLVTHGSRSNQ